MYYCRGRTLESGTSTFSNAQIAEHYATCVKLSAENVSPVIRYRSININFY